MAFGSSLSVGRQDVLALPCPMVEPSAWTWSGESLAVHDSCRVQTPTSSSLELQSACNLLQWVLMFVQIYTELFWCPLLLAFPLSDSVALLENLQ